MKSPAMLWRTTVSHAGWDLSSSSSSSPLASSGYRVLQASLRDPRLEPDGRAVLPVACWLSLFFDPTTITYGRPPISRATNAGPPRLKPEHPTSPKALPLRGGACALDFHCRVSSDLVPATSPLVCKEYRARVRINVQHERAVARLVAWAHEALGTLRGPLRRNARG